MALKKFRSKSKKAVKKRVKITKGGDLKEGKIIVNRINNSRLHLKKSRTTKLRARRDTVLNDIHSDLKTAL